MFKPTDPQRSMFESEFVMPAAKVARLKKSWAEAFRTLVMPAVDEERFREAFPGSTGRPNKSIRVLVGLHLLKEWNDLTDEQVIEQFEYNLQWHHALDVVPDEAHVCQKTLHNFRVRLMENDRAQGIFEDVTQALAKGDRIRLGQQRLDSTHVLSNIAVLTRLGLFVETVTNFLRELQREQPEALAELKGAYVRRYLEREGYFSDAKREQAKRRLPVVAQDVYALLCEFREDVAVRVLPSYLLLQRLFDEQCMVLDDDEPDAGGSSAGGGESGEGGSDTPRGGEQLRVALREPRDIKADTLQSPYDPDATYGHKGKGYEVQVAETCADENPYQLVTVTSVNGAHESDQRATIPMLDKLTASGMKPTELLADTGYGSGANIVAAAERDVDLHAPVQDPNAPPAAEPFAAPAAQMTDTGEHRSVQLHPGLIGLLGFAFDTTCQELMYCPAGHAPIEQHMAGGRLLARFSVGDCEGCPLAEGCATRLLANGDRQLYRAPATIATELRQAEQTLPSFKDEYRKRSGIESTNAELKGRHGLGRLRVRGRPRVTLAVILKSLALNVKRAARYHARLFAAPQMVASAG